MPEIATVIARGRIKDGPLIDWRGRIRIFVDGNVVSKFL